MPVALATLAAYVRQGVDSPEKLAVLHVTYFGITRVRGIVCMARLLTFWGVETRMNLLLSQRRIEWQRLYVNSVLPKLSYSSF